MLFLLLYFICLRRAILSFTRIRFVNANDAEAHYGARGAVQMRRQRAAA